MKKLAAEAVERGWFLGSDREVGALNEYWDWCCENRCPYIRVRKKRKYAEVAMDLMPGGGKFGGDQIDLFIARCKEMMAGKKRKGYGVALWYGEDIVTFSECPVEGVEGFVDFLVKLYASTVHERGEA